MKKILTAVFVTLGVIFLLILIALASFIIIDPYNIKPFILGTDSSSLPRSTSSGETMNTTSVGSSSEVGRGDAAVEAGDAHGEGFTLSAEQVAALEAAGLDPASIPTTVNAELEACFVTQLGADRVAAVKSGAVPGALELLRAQSCL